MEILSRIAEPAVLEQFSAKQLDECISRLCESDS